MGFMTSKDEIQLPKHLGIIIDGNRRWAKAHKLTDTQGHYKGAENLKTISLAAFRFGVQNVSAYVFSPEMWHRSKEEVTYLMKIIILFLDKHAAEFRDNDIKIVHVGSREGLPKGVLDALDKAVKQTEKCRSSTLALCINYDGQQEIVDAVKKLLRQKIDPVRLKIEDIQKSLYVPVLPPLELIVRTAGDYRTNSFMMWRAAHAEYVFVDKLWPDFTKQDLRLVLLYYAKRQKQFHSRTTSG